MRSRYQLWFADPFGVRLGVVRRWVKAEGYRKVNSVGKLTLTVPRNAIPSSWLVRDARLDIWRDERRFLSTVWLLRGVKKTRVGLRRFYELTSHDAIDLLDGAIVAYAAGSAQAVKSGAADNLIKAYARENIGSLATDTARSLAAYISIDADVSAAPTTYKTAPRRRLLGVCQDLARASTQLGTPLFFDLEPNNSTATFTLRTYTQQRGFDHRRTGIKPVSLSPELQNLSSIERTDDFTNEYTVVYAAGQGLEDQRLVVTVTDDARLGASPFGRRERFVDARHLAAVDSLNSEAAAALYQGRPKRQILGVVRSTPQCTFGVHWDFGDLVEVSDAGDVTSGRIDLVHFVLGDREQFTAELYDLDADSSGGVSVEQQVEQQGTYDAATITQTPTAYAVPQAGVDGTLADGWLSSAISRITSIGLSLPAIFTVTGSPLTANGTISATLANQSANTVFSGPSSGAAAAPTFRVLVAGDIPSLDSAKIATGEIPRSPLTTRGDLLTRDASTHARVAIGASGRYLRSNGTDPSWSQLDMGDAAAGTLAVARGGTGVTALPAFGVHKNGTNQTISASTWVKVTWSTEDFDSNSNFASDRWTPTIAGKYLLVCTLQYNPDLGNAISNGVRMLVSMWKNGVEHKRSEATSSGNNYYYPQVSAVVSANGSTDFFEIYTFTTSGVSLTIGGESYVTHWSGVWVAP